MVEKKDPKDCAHNELPDNEHKSVCTGCGKTAGELFENPEYINPFVRVSQQPHGKSTLYCNACDGYQPPVMWDGEEVCSRHQRYRNTEEGMVPMYDEFDQDGEAY